MLFNPHPDPECPVYGYIPLDEEHSGSLSNVLRWVKGVALSTLMNATFVFGGHKDALKSEISLGLHDEIHNIYSLDRENLTVANISMTGVSGYSKALGRIEGVERKCGSIYEFGDLNVSELGWSHLALGHAVQQRIVDTNWKPSLWLMDELNVVVDMSGKDETVDMKWVTQGLDKILSILNRKKRTRVIIISEYEFVFETRALFKKYKKARIIPKPRSVAEHVKHLVAAADVVFCPKLDADECHIAALAASRPGFLIRSEGDNEINFCPSATMCSLVSSNKLVTETNVAFVHGISERWNIGKFTRCM